jgi:hypothetical protein
MTAIHRPLREAAATMQSSVWPFWIASLALAMTIVE